MKTGFLRRLFPPTRVKVAVTGAGALYLAALLVIGVMSYATANNLLFLVFSAMLALLLVSGVIGRLVLAGLELELILPARVFARTPAEARIRVRNLKRRSPSFSLELAGSQPGKSGDFAFLRRPVYFPVVPGGAVLDAPVEVVFPGRGPSSRNTVYLSSGFPFGLIRRRNPVELACDVLVLPAISPVPAADVAAARTAARRSAVGDFSGIRPASDSDDARHLDWKSTARTGAIHVREFSTLSNGEVEVIFDPRIPPGGEAGFEQDVERCASLCMQLSRERSAIRFSTGSAHAASSGVRAIYDILCLLAEVKPEVIGAAFTVVNGLQAGPETTNRVVIGAATQ